MHENNNSVVDHFFRHEYAKVFSLLNHKFGNEYFDLIEDAIQEALVKAMQSWGYSGTPKNAPGWIYRVAYNQLIDSIRKFKTTNSIQEFSQELEEAAYPEEEEIEDSQLKMMFVCCHPNLSESDQLILILKILCGFNNTETARALLKKEDTIAKAYTRAKNKIQSIPELQSKAQPHLHQERIQIVLQAIYLLFNEGYNTTTGDVLFKKEICAEAIRLCVLLEEHPKINDPSSSALIALMSFQSSRFQARIGKKGEIITLDRQDRTLWDFNLIQLGKEYLEKAHSKKPFGKYHLEASIAACYSFSPSFSSIDWKTILALYNALQKIEPNPIADLNRIVVLEKVSGPELALKSIAKLKGLENYYLYNMVYAELLKQCGAEEKANVFFKKALELTKNDAEKVFINDKLKQKNKPSL